MSIRSGIAAQIGYAAETTYGTYATPTRFLEVNAFAVKNAIERIESNALRSTNRVLRSDRWVANPKGVAGTVEHEVQSKGFGLLFKHMLGGAAIATPSGGTNTRDQTFTLGDTYGLSLTVQAGIPDVSGTVQPFSWLGTKVASWTLTNDVDGILMLELTLDGASETTAESLAAASYPASSELLTYVGGLITIGGVAYDVTSFELTGENGLKTDRYFIRQNTAKMEPIIAAPVGLSGSIGSEFVDLTQYQRFTAGTVGAVVAKWEGSTIESSFKYTVQVTLPAVRFDGETPEVGGPDVVPATFPFRVLNDGSNEPITVLYRSTDTSA